MIQSKLVAIRNCILLVLTLHSHKGTELDTGILI